MLSFAAEFGRGEDAKTVATRDDHPAPDRLDAVLPLIPRDLERAERLLIPSIRHYFAALGTCWIVVPDADLPAMAARLADPRFTCIGEDDLIPELRWFRHPPTRGRVGGLTGSDIQQLAKLAIARRLDGPFYVTLDADVLCCRALESADLIPGGRALSSLSDAADDAQRKASEQASALLGTPKSGRRHGSTPAVLSRDGVLALLAFLEERLKPNALRAEALLLSHLPWDPYSLYDTFLEHAGLLDRYHVLTPARTVGNNLKAGQSLSAWDPAASFAPPEHQSFSVLQRHAAPDVDAVVARIRDYFASIAEPSPI